MARTGQTGSIFEGRTLDDAVRKGLEALGLSRAEVMITMLEEGSGGFLGLGARPYKVRIMPRPGGAIHEPEDRGEARRREGRRGERGGRDRAARGERGGRGGRDRRPEGGGEAPARGRGRDERGGRRDARPEREARPRMESRAPQPRSAETLEPPRDREERQDREPRGDRAGDERGPRRGRRGGRGRDRAPFAGDERRPAAVAPMRSPEPDVEEAVEHRRAEPQRDERPAADPGRPSLAPAALEAEGKRWAEQLLAAMGFTATVTASAEEDRVDVTATVSEEEDLLTGRKGEVRQALQHLLNLMLNRGGSTRYHLQLEINDFWQRREAELTDLARRLADEAVETQSETVTEYLNSQERRVIHVTLREDARVKTYSLGTGMIKRLAVAPAHFAGGARDED